MKKKLIKIIDSLIMRTEGELLTLQRIKCELESVRYSKGDLEKMLAYLTINYR